MRNSSIILLCAIAVTITSEAASTPDAKRLDNLFGGPFELTATDYSRVTDVSLRGKFLLVMFGYTNCPDICPLAMSIVGEAIDRLGEQSNSVQPVFITVDPERDTPQKLGEYAKSFHPRFLMLSGTEKEIAAVAKAYRVHRSKYALSAQGADDSSYGVDHGSLIYLIGPDGKFRTIFPHGTSAEQISQHLRRYLERINR